MASRKTPRQNADRISEQIDQCMIADRFRLRRQLKQKGGKSVGIAVEKSLKRVAARRTALPTKVEFPEELPVSGKAQEIQAALARHQVVIVAGETGSGKTTQLPKVCLEAGRGVFGMIGHTQPRRVAARTVAHRIADELGVSQGSSVGYQIRFGDKTGPDTHIKVMTDGILLAETRNDRFLERYDTLIIDEAHERSLNIDFLLGYIKRILPKRPDLKVIITSATIDVASFSRHFGDAPVIEVSGRTYPVELAYRPLDELLSEAGDAADDDPVSTGIVHLMREVGQREKGQRRPADVLVFLPGEREIREASLALRRSSLKGWEVLPLYSRLSHAEQDRVFQPHQGRRVVLATNVAETSITVPGIRYVIDPGLARISRYSIRAKVQQLPIERVSQASARQRAGRCGRISEGVCFRLYDEEDFEQRSEYTAPEIMRTSLASVILQMLYLKLGDIDRFPFVEPPDRKQVNDGYHLLFELGAVDAERRMTRLGRDLVRIPVDLRLGRMLAAAFQHGVLSEALIIVSVLAIADPRERPMDAREAADKCHAEYDDERSDFLSFLNLWQAFETKRQSLSQRQLRRFCRENFLSWVRMREWREHHRQLRLICEEMGMRVSEQPAQYDRLHKSLLAGLLGNIGQRVNDNAYQGPRGRRHYLFPASTLFKRKPAWVMSAELTETTRLYARTVARIEPDWIEPISGHLVKRRHSDPFFSRKRGEVMAYEDVSLYGVPIVARRPVSYGAIDPATSRQIFIQEGLVDQQLKTRAGFFEANKQLRLRLGRLEDKTRRRDIMVDDRAIYAFYDERIPDHVAGLTDLDLWRSDIERTDRKRLYMTQEDLQQKDDGASETAYPSTLSVGNNQLPLNYRFDPTHHDDGVSVNIPVSILQQVSEAQVDWLIPGMLEEKCTALIRSLPKALRRNFAPVPDFVQRVLPQLEYDGRSLKLLLAEKLHRESGVRIQPEDFEHTPIADHLKMNVRLVDERGKVLAAGRELDKLRGKLDDVAASPDPVLRHPLEQHGLKDWPVEPLPDQVRVKVGGIEIVRYPALIDEELCAGVKLFETKSLAQHAHRHGVVRLLYLKLKEQVRYMHRNIPDFDRFSLWYATRGKKEELREDLILAALRYHFVEDQPQVLSGDVFEQRLASRDALVETMERVASLVAQVLREAASAVQALDEVPFQHAVDDIRGQLSALLDDRFLMRTDERWLKHMPRYMKAIRLRIEKLSGHENRDEQLTHELGEWLERIAELEGQGAELQWTLQEYRVSLFAQSLGTSQPVSAKRLERAIENIRTPR